MQAKSLATRAPSLVTGAGGYLGRHIVNELLKRGSSVRALCRSSQQAESLRELGAEPIIGDITDAQAMMAAARGMRHVYHIAALFRRSGIADQVYRDINVQGTANVIAACEAAGVERFVHCSTVGVHGDVGEKAANELTPFSPGDIYQSTKLEGELLAKEAFEKGRLRGGIIRPAMIYGPGDTRLLKLFKMIANGTFFYVGSGNAFVHFIDVRDLARAFCDLAEREHINGEAFIIAGEQGLRLNALVELLAQNFGRSKPWLHLPVRPMRALGGLCEAICTPFGINPPLYRRRVDFFTKNRLFDTAKAKEMIDFAPEQSLYGELVDIINSYVESGDIKLSRLEKPGTFWRHIDGTIFRWDSNAEKIYGWSTREAVGSVSHSLLRTEFPEPLEAINAGLQKKPFWEGILVHTRSDGKRIKVRSRWEKSRTGDREIIETNLVENGPGLVMPSSPIWLKGGCGASLSCFGDIACLAELILC